MLWVWPCMAATSNFLRKGTGHRAALVVRSMSRRIQSSATSKSKRPKLASEETSPLHADSSTVSRCTWAAKFTGAADPEYVAYHDEEWGQPIKDDVALYELLVLEGAQAGLSWHTILKRREGYRKAFANFNPDVVAQYDDDKVSELMQDTGIIRHKGKIVSAINNARCVLKVQEELGSFSKLIWSFAAEGGHPIINKHATLDSVPAKTVESEAMSKELKKRGFAFVGPTTCYSFMQGAGLVNDHLVDCFCYRPLCQLASSWDPP